MNRETTRVIKILEELSARVGLKLRHAEDQHQAAQDRAEAAAGNERQIALEKRIAARWAREAAADQRIIKMLHTDKRTVELSN